MKYYIRHTGTYSSALGVEPRFLFFLIKVDINFFFILKRVNIMRCVYNYELEKHQRETVRENNQGQFVMYAEVKP